VRARNSNEYAGSAQFADRPRAMSNIGRKASAAVLARITRHPARGEVFWWLYDHHDEIKVRTLGTRISWRTVLADLTALGLTNARGQPVRRTEALKLTYHRVRQLKRREAEARALMPPRGAPLARPHPIAASPFTQNSLFSVEERLPELFGLITNRGADDG
jgi:hypothetical protein